MTATHPRAPLLVAALGCRCPRCGKGRLFAGYLRIAPACEHCGLSFAGNDTGDGPAFFIMLPLSIATAVFALLFEVKAQPPLWLHMVIWPIFIALAVGLLLRPVKATMVALQYRYRDVESDAGNTQV
jgi:uncharacterized protein (DUF983 family)